MNLSGKKALVVGLGKSGVAVAQFLRRRGADVTATDSAAAERLGPLTAGLRQAGVVLELGGHRRETFESAELIVISPGVPHQLPEIEAAVRKGAEVIGEIELAARFIDAPIAAVTGTNGKTTTCSLVGAMLSESGIDVFVGGNIGDPLTGYVDRGVKAAVVVAEISSFQLDTIVHFKPAVAVLLNIADDHLDRYPDFDGYLKSKARIFENQQGDDVAVINGSDANVQKAAAPCRARRLVYRRADADLPPSGFQGAWIRPEGVEFFLAEDRAARPSHFLPRAAIGLPGNHNVENAAAAVLTALSLGGSYEAAVAVLKCFSGLPHRLEYVAAVGGVRYFNDSKATNVDAVVRALEGFSEPVVLIMGGRNKGSRFEPLRPAVAARVRHLVVMGEARDEIRRALQGDLPVTEAGSMNAAVRQAAELARPGDVVLLAPGCASFDMYTSYAERGRDFRQAVADLQRAAGTAP
ncbi:MAG TPA: UDP-N-acetylmuramoyl-L-alanine--D-glutamate ligase [Desulfobacterales bacterium]